MDEEELKRIHGDDVELAPDDSEDENLTEQEAIALAKEEGIEFIDEFIENEDGSITQTRRQRMEGE